MTVFVQFGVGRFGVHTSTVHMCADIYVFAEFGIYIMSGNVPVGYHAVGDLLQDGLGTLAVGNFL